MSGASGGPKPPDQARLYSQAATGSFSATSARVEGGGNATEVRMRSFAEILASEHQERNILEIHLTRLSTEENNVMTKVKALTYDDLGELIFDVLNVDYSQCAGFNYTTGRYDTREIKFKSGVDLSPYIRSGIVFKGHEVSTKKQMNNMTKVTFRNVPFNIPDEEIIQLCRCYGNPLNNKVHYERLYNNRNKGMMGSTRWVEMELKTSMNNFYWLEGPLPGDTGSRVTVLHSGQEQQCSNCLKTGRTGCKAFGNGKVCVQLKTPRARMVDYMTELKRVMGYESLKTLHYKQFPSLQAEGLGIMDDRPQGEEDEDDDLVPTNPIERRDARIAELEKTVADMPALQEAVVKTKAELSIAKRSAHAAKNRVKFARKVTEERLKECLPADRFEDDFSKVLVTLMTTLIDEECYEFDPDSETVKPKVGFLKDIEDSIEKKEDNDVLKERLESIKNKMLDRVQQSAVQKKQRRSSISSISSVSSNDGRKRQHSGETENLRSILKKQSVSTPST